MTKVINVHERPFDATPQRVGALLDSLASPQDTLWPNHSWPRMEFDRPLVEGAAGGHGPIRYFVEEYTPGTSVRFRFTGPNGFDGYHGFEILVSKEGPVVLRHTLTMTTRGLAVVSWPLLFRPLHDALVEDALATAEISLGLPQNVRVWSLWVRFLRWSLSGGKAGPQITPRA